MESPLSDQVPETLETGTPSERKPGGVKAFIHHYRRPLFLWGILVLFIILGYFFNLNRHLMTVAAILWGLGTQIFYAALTFMLPYIGAVPLVGPVLVKLITVPLFILINAVAFLASLVGLKIGHKRTVFESRVAATILMIGILLGYILGKLF